MKREIKFRAYSKSSNVMFKPFSIWDVQNTYKMPSDFVSETKPILMQYTGLKDKNGKEIYEGDVFNNPVLGTFKIIFNDGSFCYEILKRSEPESYLSYPKGHIDTLWMKNVVTNYEIIGNIYQDKHLLK